MKAGFSKSKDNKIRIDYEGNGSKATALFERVGDETLESGFDQYGSITNQTLLKEKDADAASKRFLKALGCEVVPEEYRAVTLQMNCPKCGASPLARYLDTVVHPKDAPVMPFYVCTKCKTRSYHLTDQYLKNLVTGNKALFETSELSELGKNESAFMLELRAYIIRIFASQRIMHIK